MMIYNREKGVATLVKVQQTAFSNHSQMTVLTGRQRIKDTKKIRQSQ